MMFKSWRKDTKKKILVKTILFYIPNFNSILSYLDKIILIVTTSI